MSSFAYLTLSGIASYVYKYYMEYIFPEESQDDSSEIYSLALSLYNSWPAEVHAMPTIPSIYLTKSLLQVLSLNSPSSLVQKEEQGETISLPSPIKDMKVTLVPSLETPFVNHITQLPPLESIPDVEELLKIGDDASVFDLDVTDVTTDRKEANVDGNLKGKM